MQAPSNAITFSDEDLLLEGMVHNHPLFIQAIVKFKKTSYVMVDNGFAINVYPPTYDDSKNQVIISLPSKAVAQIRDEC